VDDRIFISIQEHIWYITDNLQFLQFIDFDFEFAKYKELKYMILLYIMSDNLDLRCFPCPFCSYVAMRKDNLQKHLNRSNKCFKESTENCKLWKDTMIKHGLKIQDKVTCPHCKEIYVNKYSLQVHLDNACQGKKITEDTGRPTSHSETSSGNILLFDDTSSDVLLEDKDKDVNDLISILSSSFNPNQVTILAHLLNRRDEIMKNHIRATVKDISPVQQTVNQQNFQVVAVNGDIFELLTNLLNNDPDQARLKLANCAMGTIESDCRLINQIYRLDSTDESPKTGSAIRFVDSKQQKTECFDTSGRKIIKTKAQLGDSLAMGIINAYSLTLDYFQDYYEKQRTTSYFHCR